jgi:hypothetical protein
MDAQMGEQPTSNQSPDDANSYIGDEAKTCSLDDLASEPSRDEPDKQNDK